MWLMILLKIKLFIKFISYDVKWKGISKEEPGEMLEATT